MPKAFRLDGNARGRCLENNQKGLSPNHLCSPPPHIPFQNHSYEELAKITEKEEWQVSQEENLKCKKKV